MDAEILLYTARETKSMLKSENLIVYEMCLQQDFADIN